MLASGTWSRAGKGIYSAGRSLGLNCNPLCSVCAQEQSEWGTLHVGNRYIGLSYWPFRGSTIRTSALIYIIRPWRCVDNPGNVGARIAAVKQLKELEVGWTHRLG